MFIGIVKFSMKLFSERKAFEKLSSLKVFFENPLDCSIILLYKIMLLEIPVS